MKQSDSPSRPTTTDWPAHRRHRLFPRGIRGRLFLIIAVGVLAAQGITGWLFRHHHRWEYSQNLTQSFGKRVVAIATLLDSTPQHQQTPLIQTLNNPLLQIQQQAEAPNQRKRPDDRSLERLRSQLTQARNKPFVVQLRTSKFGNFNAARNRSGYQSKLWPSYQQLVIALENSAGEWWVFTTPYDMRFSRPGRALFLLLLVTGIVVWLLSVWAARRVTAPILKFAAAADRLGMDVNAPPLAESGAKELRQAAEAFNQMQTRLQRLIADRTFMLAAISHDLKTVLTRLRLRTEFIEDATQQQKAEADLTQMEAMLTSTLVFAKEDSTPEERTQLDLASLLQSICDDLSDAGSLAQYHGPDRLNLLGQPIALRRAFTNLIENAVLYGQEATVKLDKEAGELKVAIADRGPGIPEELQEKVFQPFFRLEPSRNRETGGTGLGLAVAQTAIRRHGGEIQFSPRDGGGLVVEVTFPVDRS